MRGAWIEIVTSLSVAQPPVSPPMRGAWIEMIMKMIYGTGVPVAPHAGGVD